MSTSTAQATPGSANPGGRQPISTRRSTTAADTPRAVASHDQEHSGVAGSTRREERAGWAPRVWLGGQA